MNIYKILDDENTVKEEITTIVKHESEITHDQSINSKIQKGLFELFVAYFVILLIGLNSL